MRIRADGSEPECEQARDRWIVIKREGRWGGVWATSGVQRGRVARRHVRRFQMSRTALGLTPLICGGGKKAGTQAVAALILALSFSFQALISDDLTNSPLHRESQFQPRNAFLF